MKHISIELDIPGNQNSFLDGGGVEVTEDLCKSFASQADRKSSFTVISEERRGIFGSTHGTGPDY